MHSPANYVEWKEFRAARRADLKALQGRPLRPGIRAEAWTPREVLHHVLLVEESSATLLERLMAKAKEKIPRSEGPWPIRSELMDFPLDTAFSVPAFKGTEPRADVSDKVLAQLEKSNRARHETLASQAEVWDLSGVSFPHPLAGRMNFYEWLTFDGVHEGLHLTQLRSDVVESSGLSSSH